MTDKLLVDELAEALNSVATWIDGWDPNFIHDDEWPETDEQIQAVLVRYRAAKEAEPDLVEVLERITKLSAGGPHIGAKDGMASALAALDRARDIASAALARAKSKEGQADE